LDAYKIDDHILVGSYPHVWSPKTSLGAVFVWLWVRLRRYATVTSFNTPRAPPSPFPLEWDDGRTYRNPLELPPASLNMAGNVLNETKVYS
jgi:hypothetical protein